MQLEMEWSGKTGDFATGFKFHNSEEYLFIDLHLNNQCLRIASLH